MKIILVATNAKGKNLVFITDTLQAYSLQEAVQLAKERKLENVYPVNSSTGAYLRTTPNTPRKEQLDRISISSYQLFSLPDNLNYALTTPAFGNYWPLYQHSLEENGGQFIIIDDYALITKEAAKAKLQPHRNLVFAAAKKFDVNPYLLGAIIIDEIARFAPYEIITDPLGGHFIGVNTSVGITQVKIETARDLIEKGYYNPNPADKRLSPQNIKKISRQELYPYLKNPEHSIFFAAAKMRALIDEWQKYIDISKSPDIIATLYSRKGKTPHAHPQPNDRGLQIANEFYKLAKEWLR